MIKNDKIMRKELSGHLYYGNIYETSNNCGNCDGARCHCCKEVYIVESLISDDVLYAGYSEDEALDIINKNSEI